jgi:hypothetical protein
MTAYYRCKRCKDIVRYVENMGDYVAGKCNCKESPSPWEPIPLLPETPADLRDLLKAIGAAHESNGGSIQKTNLGSLIHMLTDIAMVATPGDFNGPYRQKMFELNPRLVLDVAARAFESFKVEGTQS